MREVMRQVQAHREQLIPTYHDPQILYEARDREYLRLLGEHSISWQDYENYQPAAGTPEPSPGITEKKDTAKEHAEQIERRAAAKLKLGLALAREGHSRDAREFYADIISKYPQTKAAEQARKLLATRVARR